MCNVGSGQLQSGRSHDGSVGQGAEADAGLPNGSAAGLQAGPLPGEKEGALLGCSGCAELGYCRRGLAPEEFEAVCGSGAP